MTCFPLLWPSLALENDLLWSLDFFMFTCYITFVKCRCFCTLEENAECKSTEIWRNLLGCTMAIVNMSVSKRHSSCKWPRGDSHLFWYNSAEVCESGPGTYFVHFFFFQVRVITKDGDTAFVSPLWIPLCFVLTLLELVCLLSCVPFRVSRVKENKYPYSYCVSGSNNNMKKESTTNQKNTLVQD